MAKPSVVKTRQDGDIYAPPPIRLQVWYYTEEGKNSKINHKLGQSFSKAKLHGWTIRQAESITSPQSLRDKYVPIEVDFVSKPSYRQCCLTPDESLRELFEKTLPPLINAFLEKIKKKAQHINMYPIGTFPKQVTQMYTHIRIEHSLAMDYNRVAQSVPPRENPMGNTIQNIVTAIPDSAALATGLYVKFGQLSVQGEFVTDMWHNIKNMLSTSTLPDEALKLCPIPDMKASWTKIIISAKCFQELVGDIQECANKISEKSVIGNHDLYYLVSQVAVAMNIFSIHQREMETLHKLILKKFENDSKSVKRKFTIAVAIFVCSVAIFSTGGLAMAPILSTGFAGCSAAVASGFVIKGGCDFAEIEKRKGAVADFDGMVQELGIALGRAQFALSEMFCSQVLKMPLELMSIFERKTTLRNLGVDVADLQNESYLHGLSVSEIETFVSVYRKYEKKRKEVELDIGLRDAKETIKTCE